MRYSLMGQNFKNCKKKKDPFLFCTNHLLCNYITYKGFLKRNYINAKNHFPKLTIATWQHRKIVVRYSSFLQTHPLDDFLKI